MRLEASSKSSSCCVTKPRRGIKLTSGILASASLRLNQSSANHQRLDRHSRPGVGGGRGRCRRKPVANRIVTPPQGGEAISSRGGLASASMDGCSIVGVARRRRPRARPRNKGRILAISTRAAASGTAARARAGPAGIALPLASRHQRLRRKREIA